MGLILKTTTSALLTIYLFLHISVYICISARANPTRPLLIVAASQTKQRSENCIILITQSVQLSVSELLYPQVVNLSGLLFVWHKWRWCAKRNGIAGARKCLKLLLRFVCIVALFSLSRMNSLQYKFVLFVFLALCPLKFAKWTNNTFKMQFQK